MFAAFCLVFTLTITDFGVPVVVGGDSQVLALEAYKAVVGQQQFGRGALIGMVLLLPALFSFGVDAWLRRRHGDSMSGRAQVFKPAPSKKRDAFYFSVVLLISAALLLVFGMAVFSSLVKFWPYNLSLSLNHYQFNETAGGGWLAYGNSLKMALGTALIGSVLIFTGVPGRKSDVTIDAERVIEAIRRITERMQEINRHTTAIALSVGRSPSSASSASIEKSGAATAAQRASRTPG